MSQTLIHSKYADKKFINMMAILARRFTQVHRRYIKYFQCESKNLTELGWYHNERANISFLAAAAWREPKWVAMEEFPAKKVGSQKRLGRVDLYIGTPACDLNLEAKHVWVPGPKTIFSALDPKNKKSKLSLALRDARHAIRKSQVAYRCGAVFLCPQIKEKRFDAVYTAIIEAFEGACKNLINKNWAAFSVESSIPHQLFSAWGGGRFAFPAIGVVIVET